MRSFADARLGLAAVVLTLQGAMALAQYDPTAPKTTYLAIRAREAAVRRDLDTQPPKGTDAPVLRRIRAVVGEYERMAKGYRQSGYSDNALYQAAVLAA